METIEFDIKLKAKDLFLYTLRHTYFSFSGVFSLLISFVSLILFLVNIKRYEVSTLGVLLLIALLFTVVQPALLYVKCRAQIKKSEDINDVLHYTLTEDLIQIRQEENKVEVHWYDIRKAVYLKSAVYLYMSQVRAFIFPKDACGEQFENVIQMVKTGMEKYKDYEPEDIPDTDGEQNEENNH